MSRVLSLSLYYIYQLLRVKSAKGDTVTTVNLFSGLSANKMIDTPNTERHSILYQKWFKIRAANRSSGNATTLRLSY